MCITISDFRVDSLDKLKAKLIQIENETLRDNNKFRDLYIFSFGYAKNPNQKGIELEMAIPYWNILLQGRFPLLTLWTEFLQVSTKWKANLYDTSLAQLMMRNFCCRNSTNARYLVILGYCCWTSVTVFHLTWLITTRREPGQYSLTTLLSGHVQNWAVHRQRLRQQPLHCRLRHRHFLEATSRLCINHNRIANLTSVDLSLMQYT